MSTTLAIPQRQSLLAIIFLAFRIVRQIGLVQVAIAAGFLVSRAGSLLWIIALIALAGLAFIAIASLSWWRYTFVVRNGELHVNKGVISRDTLTVPLDRIQSVSIEQKALHRLVNLVQVTLDTAGTSSAEFTIDAVDREIAVELQRVAADFRPATAPRAHAHPGAPGAGDEPVQTDAPAPTPERLLLRHSPARLAKIAVTRIPFTGLAVLAPLFAFGEEIVDFFPFDLPAIDLEAGRWLLWFVPMVITVVAIFGLLLNVVSTFYNDWNLRITRTEAGLRREAGLLSRTSVASSVPRVQSVEVSQGILQRLARLHQVTLHNIGEGDFAVPGCTSDEVALIRNVGLADSAGVGSLSRTVSTMETYRDTRNVTVAMVLLGIGLWFVVGWWVGLLAVPTVGTWLGSRRSVRLRKWGMDTDSIALRREFLGWNVHEALLRKANAVSVSQSLFERKRGLATVHVALAGGILGSGSLSIGMIPLAEATAVRDRVLYVVETDRRAYM